MGKQRQRMGPGQVLPWGRPYMPCPWVQASCTQNDNVSKGKTIQCHKNFWLKDFKFLKLPAGERGDSTALTLQRREQRQQTERPWGTWCHPSHPCGRLHSSWPWPCAQCRHLHGRVEPHHGAQRYLGTQHVSSFEATPITQRVARPSCFLVLSGPSAAMPYLQGDRAHIQAWPSPAAKACLNDFLPSLQLCLS